MRRSWYLGTRHERDRATSHVSVNKSTKPISNIWNLAHSLEEWASLNLFLIIYDIMFLM